MAADRLDYDFIVLDGELDVSAFFQAHHIREFLRDTYGKATADTEGFAPEELKGRLVSFFVHPLVFTLRADFHIDEHAFLEFFTFLFHRSITFRAAGHSLTSTVTIQSMPSRTRYTNRTLKRPMSL